MENNVIPFEDMIVKAIEQCELALDMSVRENRNKHLGEASEYFDRAYRLYAKANDDDPHISARLDDLEAELYFRG